MSLFKNLLNDLADGANKILDVFDNTHDYNDSSKKENNTNTKRDYMTCKHCSQETAYMWDQSPYGHEMSSDHGFMRSYTCESCNKNWSEKW